MDINRGSPRVLIVTPEVTALPPGMGKHADVVGAKAGGMADVSAGLVAALYAAGADVHVAVPHYRRLFHVDVQRFVNGALREYRSKIDSTRVHLAEDRSFYYRSAVYGHGEGDVADFALIFQREVINHILPRVEPDLIHCHDWTTSLIPAQARRLGIPCLFTIHNIHTCRMPLSRIEASGIDAAEFWQYLYFAQAPGRYEDARDSNSVDFLASGIFAAHFVNTVSPTFLLELVSGEHGFVPDNVRREIRHKVSAGCAAGILNAPSSAFAPEADRFLVTRYGPPTVHAAKAANKRAFQTALGLRREADAPLLFWPSRLDPVQKGCELLAHIMYDLISDYWSLGLQVAVVADGPAQAWFHAIRDMHGFSERLAVTDFREDVSHLGYAAADFVLMPSRFEPCGLPQMIGLLYGALPIVRDTGGLHDTVAPLDVSGNRGNGFAFRTYDCGGLRWAIDQAVAFHGLAPETKYPQLARIMLEARHRFSNAVSAGCYIELYERLLRRPLLNPLGTAPEESLPGPEGFPADGVGAAGRSVPLSSSLPTPPSVQGGTVRTGSRVGVRSARSRGRVRRTPAGADTCRRVAPATRRAPA